MAVRGLAYQRQGQENSGYATDEFIDRLAADAGLKARMRGAGAEPAGAAATSSLAQTLGLEFDARRS